MGKQKRVYKVLINSIDAVKTFTEKAMKATNIDIDLVYGRFVINGKSLLGIFSLDLTKTLDMVVWYDESSVAEANEFEGAIKNMIMM